MRFTASTASLTKWLSWKKVVAAVRKVYSGLVTSCHTSHTGVTPLEEVFAYKNHRFYDLDFLSISCYHTAAKLPWYWSGGAYDGSEQANYLTALVETFKNEPWWMGLAWWKWDEQNDRPQFRTDPAGDSGFTIKGKPAEKLFGAYTKEFENN